MKKENKWCPLIVADCVGVKCLNYGIYNREADRDEQPESPFEMLIEQTHSCNWFKKGLGVYKVTICVGNAEGLARMKEVEAKSADNRRR